MQSIFASLPSRLGDFASLIVWVILVFVGFVSTVDYVANVLMNVFVDDFVIMAAGGGVIY